MKLLSVLALAGSLTFACGKDSKTELQSWMQQACSCQDKGCAESQRLAFWELVQEFRDDDPSKDEAQALSELVDQGQACLSGLSVDIYALH